MLRRLGPIFLTSAALAAGSALGVWLWRRWGFPVREETRDVATVLEGPSADAPDVPGRLPVQHEGDGEGPRFHRRYEVDVEQTTQSPRELMVCIAKNIQAYVPDEIATFHKVQGAADFLAVGDEYDIRIRSPWNGPVRVAEAEPTRFTLATLDGHMEAGQIRFEAKDLPDAGLRFTIESWARSRDRGVSFVYDALGLGKEAQQAMWTFFCERVAEDCGGRRVGEIRVLTEREAKDGE